MSVSVSSSLPPTEVFLQPQGPRGGGLFPPLPETCVLPGPGAARVAFGPEIGQTGKLAQPLSSWFSLSLVFSVRFPPLFFSAGTCSLAYLRTRRFGARAVDTSGGLGGFQVVPQSFLYKEPCVYERRVISMAEDPGPASRGADPGPLGGRRSSPAARCLPSLPGGGWGTTRRWENYGSCLV